MLRLDSTSTEVHRNGTGARKTSGPQSIGKSRSGWNTKIHMISASDNLGAIFSLSGGQAHDAPEGRALLESWDKLPANAPLAINRACEGDKTCHYADNLGMTPKANRKVERLFRRVKG